MKFPGLVHHFQIQKKLEKNNSWSVKWYRSILLSSSIASWPLPSQQMNLILNLKMMNQQSKLHFKLSSLVLVLIVSSSRILRNVYSLGIIWETGIKRK